jgi:hypothetical protein
MSYVTTPKTWGCEMNIQVEQRSVYGTVKFYPVNELAEQFTRLMKQKTFDVQNLKDIKRMGVSVEVIVPTIEEI